MRRSFMVAQVFVPEKKLKRSSKTNLFLSYVMQFVVSLSLSFRILYEIFGIFAFQKN